MVGESGGWSAGPALSPQLLLPRSYVSPAGRAAVNTKQHISFLRFDLIQQIVNRVELKFWYHKSSRFVSFEEILFQVCVLASAGAAQYSAGTQIAGYSTTVEFP